MWYSDLTNIKSKGETTARPGSLAGLHEARKMHLSQFFTPTDVSALAWRLLDAVNPFENKMISIFDNSIGSGSLIWNACPEKHRVFGFDVDADCISSLDKALKNAGFYYELVEGGFEDVSVRGCAEFSLINPPYSLRLDSATIEPFESNTLGKYGPFSSANSHTYALEHALAYSSVVIAVLPTSFAKTLVSNEDSGLVACYHLPIKAFSEQGAIVKTSVCIVTSRSLDVKPIVETLKSDLIPSSLPEKFDKYLFPSNFRFSLDKVGLTVDRPVITLPVTGDKTVRVAHDGRKIKLQYQCGGTMARVANAILDKKAVGIEKQRLPSHIKYSGQGLLDAEVHCMQDDPMLSFQVNLVDAITRAGGTPVVELGVYGYLRNKIKKNKRIMADMGHVYFGPNTGDTVDAVAKCDVLVDESSMLSPIITSGSHVTFSMVNDVCHYEDGGALYPISETMLTASFDMKGVQDEWQVRSHGKGHAFPELDSMWRKKAKILRINEWLNRDYQMDDLIEAMIHPTGLVCAWDPGLGKTRFALGAAILSGVKHSLIVVKPKLIHEFLRQIKEDLSDYISFDDINVIDSESDLDLKKINFISTNRLRMLVNEQKSKNKTFARALRRRIGLAVCDEGHFISNFNTAQSKALMDLSPKKMIVMSGTIMANYPRNLHPILNIISSDATAVQPWGFRGGKLEEHFIRSMDTAYTGAKAFMDKFVTLEWVTHEFTESGLIAGAKREVPRIKNVTEYRRMLAPFVKRRVINEPAVTKYFQIPKANIIEEFLDWDIEHLKYYYKIAQEFASFWRDAHKDKKAIACILPRINAVITASCAPFIWQDKFGAYSEVTPKEERLLEYAAKWTKEGHQSIVFVNNPDHVVRICEMLENIGIKSLGFHGGISHKKRAELLNKNFKTGCSSILVSTTGCLSEGENLENASKVIFAAGRQWTPKTERQCYSRVLRPLQIKDVDVVFLHYSGSIDSYMKQMLDSKQDCANAGIDYASPELNDNEFLHLDRILGEFVNDLPELMNTYITGREKAA